MQLNSNTYCVSAWSDIVIETNGNFRVCCLEEVKGRQDYCVDDNGKVMNIATHSIREAMNSVNHKRLRLAQIQNIKHPMCDVCWKREAGGNNVPSIRKFRNNRGLNVSHECDPKGNVTSLPISLDLRLSNLCNCKCIMCGPNYSSLWYADYIELNGSRKMYLGGEEYQIIQEGSKLSSTFPRWYESDSWWNQFDELMPTLGQISFTGGEPFVQPAHDRIINKLIDAGYAKNVQLRYVSNFLAINPKILEKLVQFKGVKIVASVDDVYERHNLIRFPSNFDRVVNNIRTMETDYGIKLDFVNCTVGTYNVLAPIRMWEYFRSDKMYVGLIRNPKCYDIAYMPTRLKEFVVAEYEKSDIPQKYKNQIIGYLQNHSHSENDCAKQTFDFVTRMDKLDSMRSTNWKQVFPEIAERINYVQ